MKKTLITIGFFVLLYYIIVLLNRLGTKPSTSNFLTHDHTDCIQEVTLRGYLKEEGFKNLLILIDTLYSSNNAHRMINNQCQTFDYLSFYYPYSFFIIRDDFDGTDGKYQLFSLEYKDSIQTRKIARLDFPKESDYLEPEMSIINKNYSELKDTIVVNYTSENDFEGYNLNTLKDAYIYCQVNAKSNQIKNKKFIYILKNNASMKQLVILFFDFGKAFIIRLV